MTIKEREILSNMYNTKYEKHHHFTVIIYKKKKYLKYIKNKQN